MSTPQEKAQAFMARCPGTTMMQADRYLRDANGDVDAAVEAFAANMAKNANQQGRGGGGNPSAASSAGAGAAGNGPRMATLASLNDKKGNEYYVGGGDTSGQAVMAPKTEGGKNTDPNPARKGANPAGESYAAGIFDAARASGAENPTDFDDNGGNNVTVPFSGAGRRLGHTEGPSPVMASVVANKRKVKVTFYKDGFIIDDSNDLRSMDDEAGRAFIESISKGFIPQELATRYPNTTIDVKLIDHSNTEFEGQNLFVAFAGAGHKLNATGAASGTKVGETTGTTDSLPGHNTPIPTSFSFDENEEPKAKIVIHTPDNRRCEHRVNPNRHTVNDIRYLAAQDIPGLIPNRIDLVVRDMPPRKLTDFSQTIAEAKCANAVIMVRPFS